MDNEEFSRIRHYLGKSQSQLAQLLCVSPKAIQSFEQGWRHIPVYIERQLLMILSFSRASNENNRPCWEILSCPDEWRANCIVWEYKARHFCWLISGTFCHGKLQENWECKMNLCKQCEVFRASVIPSLENPIITEQTEKDFNSNGGKR